MQIITLSLVKYFQLGVVIKNNSERKGILKKRKIASNSNNFCRSPLLARVLTLNHVLKAVRF